MKVAIYKLTDPRDAEATPHYIGKSRNPDIRLRAHIHAATNKALRRWLNKLKAAHLRPKLVVLCWTGNWRTAERAAISSARKHNPNLFNISDGGEDGPPHDLAARSAKKLAIRLRNEYWGTPKHRIACSRAGRIGIKIAQQKIRTTYWQSKKAAKDRSKAGKLGGRRTQLLHGLEIRQRLLQVCSIAGRISGRLNTPAQQAQRKAALSKIAHPQMARIVGVWAMHRRWHVGRNIVSAHCSYCRGKKRPCSGQY